ncbi:hypothetical protein HDU97_008272 [Phlyctochytrium planicorne]|nr:hypothetical protein HDU97_008272 [Phlyctochytrium planicorne]
MTSISSKPAAFSIFSSSTSSPSPSSSTVAPSHSATPDSCFLASPSLSSSSSLSGTFPVSPEDVDCMDGVARTEQHGALSSDAAAIFQPSTATSLDLLTTKTGGIKLGSGADMDVDNPDGDLEESSRPKIGKRLGEDPSATKTSTKPNTQPTSTSPTTTKSTSPSSTASMPLDSGVHLPMLALPPPTSSNNSSAPSTPTSPMPFSTDGKTSLPLRTMPQVSLLGAAVAKGSKSPASSLSARSRGSSGSVGSTGSGSTQTQGRRTVPGPVLSPTVLVPVVVGKSAFSSGPAPEDDVPMSEANVAGNAGGFLTAPPSPVANDNNVNKSILHPSSPTASVPTAIPLRPGSAPPTTISAPFPSTPLPCLLGASAAASMVEDEEMATPPSSFSTSVDTMTLGVRDVTPVPSLSEDDQQQHSRESREKGRKGSGSVMTCEGTLMMEEDDETGATGSGEGRKSEMHRLDTTTDSGSASVSLPLPSPAPSSPSVTHPSLHTAVFTNRLPAFHHKHSPRPSYELCPDSKPIRTDLSVLVFATLRNGDAIVPVVIKSIHDPVLAHQEVAFLETLEKFEVPGTMRCLDVVGIGEVQGLREKVKEEGAGESVGEDVWGEGGKWVIVMEKLERFEMRGLDLCGVAGCVRQMVMSLMGLHALNIAHLDVTPSNFMAQASKTSPFPTLTLIDYGLSRPVEGPSSPHPQGRGTPGYISPEVLSGTGWCTAPDMYGVGIIMGQMVEPWVGAVASGLKYFGSSLVRPTTSIGVAERIRACVGVRDARWGRGCGRGFGEVCSEERGWWGFDDGASRGKMEDGWCEVGPPSLDEDWKTLEDDMIRHAADLLWRLLDPNPLTRITASMALRHPFLSCLIDPSVCLDPPSPPATILSSGGNAQMKIRLHRLRFHSGLPVLNAERVRGEVFGRDCHRVPRINILGRRKTTAVAASHDRLDRFGSDSALATSSTDSLGGGGANGDGADKENVATVGVLGILKKKKRREVIITYR